MMSLPTFPAPSTPQFRVGFGPKGVHQRLILTQIAVNRLDACDGLVVVDASPDAADLFAVANDRGGRADRLFRIPRVLTSEREVYDSTREALISAHDNLANRVAFTPLGYDETGGLSPDQSARAMLGAIYSLWGSNDTASPNQILISIHADLMAYEAFEKSLKEHFFPYRAADSASSGPGVVGVVNRWGARNFRGIGLFLLRMINALGTEEGSKAANEILRLAKARPDLFKPSDVDRIRRFDCEGIIAEILVALRLAGGTTGEAARRALESREKSFAMGVVRDEIQLLLHADRAELARAVMEGRGRFYNDQTFEFSPIVVDDMYSGTGPHDVRCSYRGIWGRIGMISWMDDPGNIHRQFIRFHRAAPETRSLMNNELFTMGMRVANREEAVRILDLVGQVAVRCCGSGAKYFDIQPNHLDGVKTLFLNLHAEYKDQRVGGDSEWFVDSLPEDLGRGMLYLNFQNGAESDWNSQILLRVLVEEFGLSLTTRKSQSVSET